ncbi:MAG TPA: pitrilysin family protein [Verrucomicrobiae bacterium]|nr:pitrilysin family protein [Verrucomicrobiae bacterium]
MKKIALLILTVALAAPFQIVRSADIVDRPEKLSFPPLKYDAPVPDQYRVQLKSGPVVYIVPDRERPLVNISVYVRTGKYLEPAGKEGLAELTGWLLTHGGAGTNSAAQLEERVAFLGAQLESSIGDNQGSVGLNLLSKDLDAGLGLLRDVLYAPRFQDDKIALRKQQTLQGMKQRNDDSSAIEDREADYLAHGEKFWANRYSTSNSIDSITALDIEKFHYAWFWPSNFVVAITGDFERDAMLAKLEKLFAGGPENVPMDHLVAGGAPPPIPTNIVFAAPGLYLVNKPDVDQGRVSLMLPGIQRGNPDYYAVVIMNNILGGGGFTSHLMNRIRSDEGLAYSVYSSFQAGVYYPSTFTIGFQSKSRTVAYACAIALEETKRMSAEPVSEAELNLAKKGIIEGFPNFFNTKEKIAEQFAQDEFTGRHAKDPQFWKNFRANLQAVTEQDVLRVAKKYLTPDQFAVLVVGNEAEILLGYPTHPVDLKRLFGSFHEWPLRDPMTMQPLAPTK